jgi:hypothetical protein
MYNGSLEPLFVFNKKYHVTAQTKLYAAAAAAAGWICA